MPLTLGGYLLRSPRTANGYRRRRHPGYREQRLDSRPQVWVGALGDEAQIEGVPDRNPRFARRQPPSHRERGVELVPAVAYAHEQPAVVRIVAVDLVARQQVR